MQCLTDSSVNSDGLYIVSITKVPSEICLSGNSLRLPVHKPIMVFHVMETFEYYVIDHCFNVMAVVFIDNNKM